MNYLPVLLILAACATADVLPVPPADLQPAVARCRPGVAQSPPPPLPRTIDTIIAAYNKAKEAGLTTEAALKDCAAKVDILLNR